jgi:hypothetical protein
VQECKPGHQILPLLFSNILCSAEKNDLIYTPAVTIKKLIKKAAMRMSKVTLHVMTTLFVLAQKP